MTENWIYCCECGKVCGRALLDDEDPHDYEICNKCSKKDNSEELN